MCGGKEVPVGRACPEQEPAEEGSEAGGLVMLASQVESGRMDL